VFVTVEGISGILEGAIRPGHYRGVTSVVAKLFHIVKPHAAFFGQKDYQQCIVIKRMVTEMNMDVEIAVQPTVREADGLAMSSRNSYLSSHERRISTVLYSALITAEQLIKSGTKDSDVLKQRMQSLLQGENGISIDYIEIADPDTLAPVTTVVGKIVILVAVRLGSTRLIDNIKVIP
jgi:pantoate--beta-alanine ligase